MSHAGYIHVEIPSNTEAGKKYVVRLTEKGWRCNCLHYLMRNKECKHIKTANEMYEDYINN